MPQARGCDHQRSRRSVSRTMQEAVFTIGHSTHPQEHFVELRLRHGITALGDVRSKPYSRLNPQFNREELKRALRERGVKYVSWAKNSALGPKIPLVTSAEESSMNGWRARSCLGGA